MSPPSRYVALPAFTLKAINAAQPGQTLTEKISPGLRLAINETTKTWFYRYSASDDDRSSRTSRQVRIGNFPALSIEMARSKWGLLREQRKQGHDPGAEVKAAKQLQRQERIKAARKLTIEQAINRYLDDVISKTRAAKGQYDTRLVLTNHLLNRLGQMDVSYITRPVAAKLLTQVAAEAPSCALLIRRECRAAWNFLGDMGLYDGANPWVDQLRGKLKQGKGTRWLTDAEVRSLLLWLPASGISKDVQDVLRLALYTACRTGELVALEWKHVDLEKGTVHLQQTKTGVARTVRFPAQAIAILKERKSQDDTEAFVFPSPQLEARHIRQHAVVWSVSTFRKTCSVKDWTAHDLRRTVRTGLARLGISNEIAEAVLGHSKGGIEGVYNLHRYEVEAGKALQEWANHVDSLK